MANKADPAGGSVTPKPPKAPKPKPPTTPYAPGGAAVPGYAGNTPSPPQPPNHTPLPSTHSSNLIDSGPAVSHYIAPYTPSQTPRQRANEILGVQSRQYEYKPPPSYLQKHPYIAREIRDARGYMDDFEYDNFMNEKLGEYYNWDNERFKARLARKEQNIRDYYADAQAAQAQGDLDYTTDNPINPRWLKHPSLTSQGTPSQLRREKYERLKGINPASPEAAAIRKLYDGDVYSKGLIDLAAVGAGGKYDVIKYHEEQLKKITGYQDTQLTKSQGWVESQQAKYEADLEKYKGHEDDPGWAKPVNPIHDHEPGIDLTSRDPRNNPLFKMKGASPYEKRLMRNQLAESIGSGDYDRQLAALQGGLENIPFFTQKPGASQDQKEQERRERINVIGDGGPAPTTPSETTPTSNAGMYAHFGQNPGDLNTFHAYIENPTGAGLTAIFDKMARPLSGLAAGAEYINRQDKDQDFQRNSLYGKLFGKDLSASFDDLNIGDIGGLAKAVGQGFYGEGLHENTSDLKSFDDVIHANAEADPEINIYDSHSYQNWMGLGGDLLFDPLNYVGIGAVKNVAKGAKALQGLPKDIKAAKAYNEGLEPIRKTTDEFMETTGIAHLAEAKEAAEIIQGRVPYARTNAERVQHVQNVQAAVHRLGELGAKHMIEREIKGSDVGKRVAAEAEEYAARRKVVLEEAGMDVVRDKLENFIVEQVDNNNLPKSALERYDPDVMLNSMTIADKIPEVEKHMDYWNKVASHMDDIYEEQGLIEGTQHLDEFGEMEKGVSTGGKGYRPTLLSGGYKNKRYSWHKDEAKYVDDLKQKRNTLERQFGTRTWSEAQTKQVKEVEDKIARAEKKLAEKYDLHQKGSFFNFMKEGIRLRAKGEDHADWQRFESIRREAEARANREGITRPEGSIESILGPELFADPRLNQEDIFYALSRARSFVYNDPELAKVQGALKGTRATAKDQAERLAEAKMPGSGASEGKIRALQKSYDDAVLARNTNQRLIHRAQAARTLSYVNQAIKLTGKQTLAHTDRAAKLHGLIQEVTKRLNKISGEGAAESGKAASVTLTDDAQELVAHFGSKKAAATSLKSKIDYESDLVEYYKRHPKQRKEHEVELDRLTKLNNELKSEHTVMPAADTYKVVPGSNQPLDELSAEQKLRAEAKKDEKKTTAARLDSEQEGATGRENWPKEWLDPENNEWIENAFDVPSGAYNDEQYYEYMRGELEKQLKSERADYWRTVSTGMDMNDVPSPLLNKEGNIDPDQLARKLNRNVYTGVWTVKEHTNVPEWNEWLDNAAEVLTREYHDIRNNIKRAKERDIERVVERQAGIDFDEKLLSDVQEIAPMFAKRKTRKVPLSPGSNEYKMEVYGERLGHDESLAHVIDQTGNSDQLYPYITFPEEPGEIYLLGQNRTNKHLEALADDEVDGYASRNGLATIAELKKGIQKKAKYRKGTEGTEMPIQGIETRLDFLRGVLTEEGWHFSGNNKDDIEHILKHEASAKEALSVPNLTGKRLFKEQHDGMTVHQAEQERDRALHKTVSSISKGWSEFHGVNEMTMHDYVTKALRSEDDFQEVMAAGPFKFQFNRMGKSEKEARTRWENGKEVTHSPWKDGPGYALSKTWAHEQWKFLHKYSHTNRVRMLEDTYKASRDRFKKDAAGRRENYIDKALERARERGELEVAPEAKKETSKEAYDRTVEWLNWAMHSKQISNKGYSSKVALKRELGVGSSDKDLLDYAEKNMVDEKKAEIKSLKEGAEKKSKAEIDEIDAKLVQLNSDLAGIRTHFRQFNDERKAAQTQYEKELAVEAITRAARLPMARTDNTLAISFFGEKYAVPKPEALHKAVERFSESAAGKMIAKAYADSFRAPSKDIPFDMGALAAKRSGMTPAIIKNDVEKLAQVWDQIPPEIRRKEFEKVRGGLKIKHLKGTPVGDALEQSVNELMPYFRGEVPAGRPNSFIQIDDINRYLQGKSLPFRISTKIAKEGINTPDDLIRSVVWGHDPKGVPFQKSDEALKDPMEMLWHLKVATNLTASDKALRYGLSKFGIWRGMEDVKGVLHKVDGYGPHHSVVEELQPQAGWELVPELDGGEHYFPPDTAAGIRNLLKMYAPGSKEQHTFLKMTDRVTDLWKEANTVPVPSYWVSNQIGEMMASWLDGVWSHVPYQRAMKMVQYGRSEESRLSASMNSHFPAETYADEANRTVGGKEVLFPMRNGEKVTVERANIAYHEAGLKSGFFNTEFQRSGAGGKLRSNPVTRKLAKGRDKTHQLAENHEDWLRMSHFLDVIAKHPGTFDEAVAEAAQRVRKFHFDYNDFSKFEKTAMARVFPFYKWTRKAAPLMMSQLFVSPGKMVAYPKVMNAVSNELTSNDFHVDENGYMPNFTGIAPSWLTNIFAFQTTSDNADNMFNAFKVPNPGIDGMSAAVNPLNKGIGLLNPMLKLPAEQIMGQPLHNPWEDERTAYNPPIKSKDERIANLLRQGGSWGSFASKAVGDNSIQKDDIISQIFGIGVYQDNYFQR